MKRSKTPFNVRRMRIFGDLEQFKKDMIKAAEANPNSVVGLVISGPNGIEYDNTKPKSIEPKN